MSKHVCMYVSIVVVSSSLSYLATGASKVIATISKWEAAVANSAYKALESNLLMQFNETAHVMQRLCQPTGTAFVIQLEPPMQSDWNRLLMHSIAQHTHLLPHAAFSTLLGESVIAVGSHLGSAKKKDFVW